MAYFANGTETMAYQEGYCWHCANWRQREGEPAAGYPIWDLHRLWSYESVGAKPDAAIKKVALDMLIPMVEEEGLNYKLAGECACFQPCPPSPVGSE